MSTVEEIKAAFEKLSLQEQAQAAQFVNGWHDDAWDQQMKRDLAEGRLDHLLCEVDADIEAGMIA